MSPSAFFCNETQDKCGGCKCCPRMQAKLSRQPGGGLARWPWHSSARGRSPYILPAAPCHHSPPRNHTAGTRQDLRARCRQNTAARAQGSEQCQQGDGRREREPFQGKGGQPTPAICHRGPGGDGGSPEHRRWGEAPLLPEVQKHPGTCKPWGSPHLPPMRPPRQSVEHGGSSSPTHRHSHGREAAATHCSLGGHLRSKEGISASVTPPSSSSPQRTLSPRSSYHATNDPF